MSTATICSRRSSWRSIARSAPGIAIEAEAQAREFYAGQAERVSDPELKQLFERLADEEAGHYALLEAERNSIIGGF